MTRLLLQGIVGSTAYGLNHADSDTDRLGVFAVDTRDLHGLATPTQTHVTKSPEGDHTTHEAAKFCGLALRANPTVTELLWLPDSLYEVRHPLGEELILLREAFLSAKYVRNAYFGYATQQFKRLQERPDGTFSSDTRNRTAKHARHLYRLLQQGYQLYTEGVLTVRLDDPQIVIDFGEDVAMGYTASAEDLLERFEEGFDEAKTVLPSAPDTEAIESWLQGVRAAMYQPVLAGVRV